jgi:hypothetical protein
MAYLSDKTRHRVGFMVLQVLMSTIGLLVTAYGKRAGARYFGSNAFYTLYLCIDGYLGLFLVTGGSFGCIPSILAYVRIISYLPRTPYNCPGSPPIISRPSLSVPSQLQLSSLLEVLVAFSRRLCSGSMTSHSTFLVCGRRLVARWVSSLLSYIICPMHGLDP